MHCPISRTKMIVITGKSNLLQSENKGIKNDTDVFRNVSIILPDASAVLYNKHGVIQNNNSVLNHP